MSLTDHARAARILADEFRDAARDAGQIAEASLLNTFSVVYRRAAAEMKRQDDATILDHACTFDHATMPTPICPACKAPRKPK